MKARAAVMVEPGTMEVREFEVPDRAPAGGAILRIVANGLCGVDPEIFYGKVSGFAFPFIPGHEMIGEIVMIDPEAAADWGVAVGDRIAVEALVYCGKCTNCLAGR